MAQQIGSLSSFREGTSQNVTVNVNSGALTTLTNAFGAQTRAVRLDASGAVTASAGVRYQISDVTFATGTLVFTTVPNDADTVTLGASTYRFKTTMALAGDVKLEATAAATLLHLVATINNTGAAGVDYFTGTVVPNASATAAVNGTNMVATAITAGSTGNAIASTETITPAADVWGASTLTGGGPTASATTALLPLNWIEYVTVTPGQKISVISNDNTFAGSLNVTELQ